MSNSQLWAVQLLPPEELKKLANLPTRDQALAILMGVMKAPIEKFVRTLAEPHTKLVRTIAARTRSERGCLVFVFGVRRTGVATQVTLG